MAELFSPKSPRPSRAQIDKVFGRDPDFARKVEKIFDDLIAASEAANSNAASLEEVKLEAESASTLVGVLGGVVARAADLAELAEDRANVLIRLVARVTRLEREITDLQEAPL